MAQHPPLPLTFVEGFQQLRKASMGSSLETCALASNPNGPRTTAQKQRSKAHEANQALKFFRCRSAETTASENPRNSPARPAEVGFKPMRGSSISAMRTPQGGKSLKPCVAVKRIKGLEASWYRLWSETACYRRRETKVGKWVLGVSGFFFALVFRCAVHP